MFKTIAREVDEKLLRGRIPLFILLNFVIPKFIE
jgi:hypothetical protein